MSPVHYFLELFETNQLTLIFVLALLGSSFLKYFNLRLPKLSRKALLIILLLLGLVVRIAWLGFSSHEPKFVWTQKAYENDIINIHAVNITKGIWFEDQDGNPSISRPIGYPMFLGLIYKLFGANIIVTNVTNLLLYLAGAYILFLLTRQLFQERAALVALFLYSVYPISVYSIALVTDEHFFIPLWYLGLYLLTLEAHGKPYKGALLVYGVIFGYAAMTRTHVIFMPVIVAMVYFLLKRPWKKVLAALVIIFTVMQLVNLPWVIRNYKIWGVPVLYTDNANYMYDNMNDYSTPEDGGHIPVKGEPGYSQELQDAMDSGNVALRHSLSAKLMTHWILTHPTQFLPLGVSRLLIFIGWQKRGVWPLWFQYEEGHYDPARPIDPKWKEFFEGLADNFYYGLFFSFFFSLAFIAKRWKVLPRGYKISIVSVSSCIFLWMMEYLIIFTERKHRFPIEPLMIVIAAYLWDYLLFEFRWEKLRLKFQRKLV